jgi:beta-aspartyl-peptidase (threonine type)
MLAASLSRRTAVAAVVKLAALAGALILLLGVNWFVRDLADRKRAELAAQERAAEKADPEAEKAIRAVLDEQVAAWNKGDLDGFMRGYWKSAEMTFFSGGDVRKGWDATLDRYRKNYQAEGKEMGKLAFEELRFDVLSADAAVVRGRYRLKTSKDEATGLFTLLVRKLPEGWRIVHDHTSK